MSVLCPITFSLSLKIVFTDFVSSASGVRPSKNGIITCLKGTVTLMPSNLLFLNSKIKPLI